MITHKWTRINPSNTRTTSDVDNDFAVYFTDNSFGIESTVTSSALADNTYYVLRHRVSREYNLSQPILIYDKEIQYYRDTSKPDEVTERYWSRNPFTGGWDLFAEDVSPSGSGGSGMVLLETYVKNFAATVVRDPNYFSIPGTTKAEFEFGVEGQAPLFGGIGTPSGSIGVNGGFDIRAFAIVETAKSEVRFNATTETVTLSAKVATLPLVSAIFPDPWDPGGDIDWKIDVTQNYPGTFAPVRDPVQEFEGTISLSGLPLDSSGALVRDPVTGAFAEFEAIWDGRYHLPGIFNDSSRIGEEVVGIDFAYFNASAPNPELDILRAREEYLNVESYVCPSDVPGSVCQGASVSPGVDFNYQSHLSDVPASSMGYGWQEVSNNRLEEDTARNQVVLHAQGGGKMRWNMDGTNFIPSSRNLYTTCEKDVSTAVDTSPNSRTARFILTSRDQSKMEFNDSGRLIRQRDRNQNSVDYIYNSTTGFLDSIEVDGGRNTYFVRRPDGQPTEIREGDPVTGRLTRLEYYTEADAAIGPLGRLRKIINPMGEVTEFRYNDEHKLYQVIDPRGEIAAWYFYDETGRKTYELVGHLARHFEYTFDGVRMREEDFADFAAANQNPNLDAPVSFGLFTNTIYDKRQRLTLSIVGRWHYAERWEEVFDEDLQEYVEVVYYEIEEEWEAETSFEYTDLDNPFLKTKEIDPDFISRTWKYNESGNVIEETDKEGNLYIYEYADELDSPLNPKHRNLLRRIQRPDVKVGGVVTTYEPTEFVYDPVGNLSEVITVKDVDSFKTEFTYTPDGLVETIKDRRGHTTVFEYSGTPHVKNQPRNLTKIKIPKGETLSDGFRTLNFTHDEYDNLESVTDDLGNSVDYLSDLLDRTTMVRDGRGAITNFVYEDALLERILLPPNSASGNAQRTTTLVHDDQGRVEEIRRQFGVSQLSRVFYDYNGRSKIQGLTRYKNGNPSSSTNFYYDHRGRLIGQLDSLLNYSRVEHPAFCKNTETISARGVRKLFRNNDRCLLEEVFNVPGFGQLESERYFKYDELGRLIQSTDYRNGIYGKAILGFDIYGGAVRNYLYDKFDRLVEMVYEDESSASWAYDPEGNVTRFTDPEGKVTKYEYFRDNLLHKAIIERGGVDVGEFVYSYDPAGRLDKIEYPASTAVEALFRDEADLTDTGIGTGFDANGNLRFLRYQKTDGTLIRRYEWTYDDSNNRTSMLEVTPTQAVMWEYGYDWWDRLVSVKRAQGANVASLPASSLQREYVFDEMDNRTFLDDHVNGVTYHYLYASRSYPGGVRTSDQLEEVLIYSSAAGHRVVEDFVSLEVFEHDLDGNMTKRTSIASGEEVSYEWTDFDRLKRVESSQNGRMQDSRYDVDGLRSRKLDRNGNSSKEYGVGISMSASVPASTSSVAPSVSYISGHQILGAEVNGDLQYFLTDALGTVRDIVDDSGDVIQSYEFNEHGIPVLGSGAMSGTFAPKTYQGALSVNDDRNDSGLYLMGHRHYAPDLGRFISRDPIGFQGGLNLFNGAGANPVTMVDPSGLDVTLVIVGKTLSNFYQGHTGMYVDGHGFYNMASGGEAGMNLWETGSVHDYIKYLDDNRYRGFEILKLRTTPEQDQKIADFLNECDAEVTWYNPAEVCSYCTGSTCAGTLDRALEYAGIFPETSRFTKYTPAALKQRLLDAGAIPGISVPAPPGPARRGLLPGETINSYPTGDRY